MMAEQSFVYELEDTDGTVYRLETTREIDETSPQGQAALQKLLRDQLRKNPATGPERWSWVDRLLERLYGPLPYTYEAELEGGQRVRVHLPYELPDGPKGEELLRQAVREHVAQQQMPLAVARQVLGGVRDAAQSAIDWPGQIVNTIGEFVSTTPPGGPGPRPRVVPELTMPQLPDTRPPATGLERGVRTGSALAADVLGMLLIPAIRGQVSKMIFGQAPTMRSVPRMFEEGRAVAKSAPTGWRTVETLARPTGVLAEELPEGARNLGRMFGLPSSTAEITALSQQQALASRRVLLEKVGDPALLVEDGPVKWLAEALEYQALRYR
jgi:hypothetical protein